MYRRPNMTERKEGRRKTVITNALDSYLHKPHFHICIKDKIKTNQLKKRSASKRDGDCLSHKAFSTAIL